MEALTRLFRGKNFSYEQMIEEVHSDETLMDSAVNLFFKGLEKKIGEAKDTLIERFYHISSQPYEAARFMWDNNTMYGYIPEEGPVSALRHGTLALGQLAVAEALQVLINCNQTTDKGMEVAKRIEKLFSDKCDEYKKEYNLNFGVYYTPAENLCYTAMKNFRKKYGILEKISDKDYFTNSIHVPVWEKISWVDKVKIESQLTGYSSAGCITYVELPDGTVNNQDALETIIDYMMEHDIPYAAINIPMCTCQECGYTGEFDVCPKCGSRHIKRLARVTGYLSSDVSNFNYGKQKEEGDRVDHSDFIIYNFTDYDSIL